MGDEGTAGPFGFDPRAFANVPAFRELAKLLSWRGGPVNWELARQMATGVTGPPRPAVGEDRGGAAFADAVRVAELWLDPVTALAAVEGPARALTHAEWVEAATTPAGLGVYVEPVATGMREALSRGLSGGDGESLLPPEVAGMGAALGEAMAPMGALLAGMQVGTIAGHLAGQLLGTYDLGVPTVDPRTIGTVGDAARRFGADYAFDETELRWWLALREALHRRMFAGVPWLRDHVGSLIGKFAAAAEFDPGRLMEQFGGAGLSPDALADPEALERLVSGTEGLAVTPTPEQQAILGRLQAVVAFVEGYSDTVVRSAADSRLTGLEQIAEATLRRRGEKGTGERFLEQLIGLDLKPADVRVGQAFCRSVVAARGQGGLDRVWQDAARLPSTAELAEPSRWLVRLAAEEAALGVVPDLDDPSTSA